VFMYQKNSEAGILAASIPFFVLFSIVLTALVASHAISKQQMQKQYDCHKVGIRLQSIYAELADKLEALNPRAKALRRQRQLAQAALLAAPTPEAKAAAYMQLKRIKTQQRLLKFQQESLQMIYRGRYLAYFAHAKIQNRFHIQHLPTKLEFEAFPKNSASPSYQPATNFKNKQRIVFSWQGKWKQQKLHGSCRVDLVKEKKWHAKIHLAKAW